MRTRSMGAATAMALALGLGAAGCTWVPLTPEGEQVRVLPPDSGGECEELGRTRSRTSTTAGPFARTPRKIEEEQAALAQNEAARMGGNAISAQGPAQDGEQLFGVYRCPGGS